MSGQKFPVNINGQQLMVTGPLNDCPGRIVPPPLASNVTQPPSAGAVIGAGPSRPKPPMKKEKLQLVEVEVPKEGVRPGAPSFAPFVGGVRVLVPYPPNARPGQSIQFYLPLALTQKPKITNEPAQIKHKYDMDGWTRIVAVLGLQFQWIRINDNGDVDHIRRFNFDKSAYVRKLEFGEERRRIRKGILSLVPASEAVVDSKIKSTDGRDLVTCSDLVQAQVKNFDEKAQWFQDTCAQLRVEWNEGHIRINVRRQFLLGDSVDAIMSLSRNDMRKQWRFEFLGEEGIDAGGLAREWFELVCQEIFDPDMGLWMSSATNQRNKTINPKSESYSRDCLVYFRFIGRVIGKAMFDRQPIKSGHLAKHIYKHMLGWPIQFKDLETVDKACYTDLIKLRGMAEKGEDLRLISLNFIITSDILGGKEVELVKDGKNIEVTNENFPEYVEAMLKYKLMDCVKPQLNELLLGFFDVIPEPLLTIFDWQELDLFLCGSPSSNIENNKLEV